MLPLCTEEGCLGADVVKAGVVYRALVLGEGYVRILGRERENGDAKGKDRADGAVSRHSDHPHENDGEDDGVGDSQTRVERESERKSIDILEHYMHDLMAGYAELLKVRWCEDGGFCGGCEGRMKQVWEGVRERVWRDCSEWFGVG